VTHEETVVGGLVHDPRRLADLGGFEPSWFQSPECRLLYWAALAYNRRNLADGRVRYAVPGALRREVGEWVRRAKGDARKTRAASGRAAMLLLDSPGDPVSDDAWRDSADRVREAQADRVACAGILAISESRRKGADPAGMARQIQDLAASMGGIRGGTSGGLLSRDAAKTLTDYEAAKAEPNRGYIPTPWAHLNRVARGGRHGRLWMVAGYAKQGKSITALQLCYHALGRGFGGIVFTAEQTEGDVRDMLVARHSHHFHPGGLPTNAISDGSLDAAGEKALGATVRDLAAGRVGPIAYEERGGAPISALAAIAESYARKQRVDFIMIDHTDLFEPSERQASDVSRVAKIIKECKQLALGFRNRRGVWVILCHQIKREGFEAAVKRGFYVPSDMAGSSEAEKSADLMLWILRDEKMIDVHEARVGVGIDRRGPGEPRGFELYERFESAALLEFED
jgi:hypothetical protein